MAKLETDAAAPAVPNDDDKTRGQRSPLYPFIPLGKAIERAQVLYAGVKKNPTRVPVAASYWKYGAKSSGGPQTIAALKQFGLLSDQGTGESRRVVLTDLALRLVLGNDEEARREAVQRAALLPTIHAELWGKWSQELPGDASIRDYLIFDRKFNPAGADDLIREYRDTLAFAGLLDSDSESLPDGDKAGGEVPAMDTPAISQGARSVTKLPIPPIMGEHERLRFTLSGGRAVRLIFGGPPPTQAEINELMEYLMVSKRTFPTPQQVSYRDRHYPLKDGRWHSQIYLQEFDGSTMKETQYFPPEGAGIFATEEEAKQYNAAMFRKVCEGRGLTPLPSN